MLCWSANCTCHLPDAVMQLATMLPSQPERRSYAACNAYDMLGTTACTSGVDDALWAVAGVVVS